jgi:hypothetical protein
MNTVAHHLGSARPASAQALVRASFRHFRNSPGGAPTSLRMYLPRPSAIQCPQGDLRTVSREGQAAAVGGRA